MPPKELYSVFAPRPKPPSLASQASEPLAQAPLHVAQPPPALPVDTPVAGRATTPVPAVDLPVRRVGQVEEELQAESDQDTVGACDVEVLKKMAPTSRAARANGKDKAPSLPSKARKRPASIPDDDSDDDLIIVESAARPAPARASTKPKAKKRATSVIVIPDSPVKSLVELPGGLRPTSQVHRATLEKHKAREGVEARWPTVEEHGGDPTTSRGEAGWGVRCFGPLGSSEGKGKGRDEALLGESVLTAFGGVDSGQPATKWTTPRLVHHPLADVGSLLPPHPAHPLLDRLARPFEVALSSRGAFLRPEDRDTPAGVDSDLAKSSQQIWTTKYAPQSAEEVLGSTSGRSAGILKEWLSEHTLLGTSDEPEKKKRRRVVVREATKPKKRKRGGSSDLDDFLAPSDEEDGKEGYASSESDGGGPSFVPRGQAARETFASQLTNLILLCGPTGSGKSSTVHTVAKELGWSVFEVYPGMMKRTAKEVAKHISGVSTNHTIKGGGGPASPTKAKDPFAMFRKTMRLPSPVKMTKEAPEPEPDAEVESRTSQSLILLDEVDVLYGDEESFWPGFINLVKGSRRPVVLTCTDPSTIPFAELALQPIFVGGSESSMLHFAPPEPAVVTPFLQLVALSEGHLLSPPDLNFLYDVESRAPNNVLLQDGPASPLPHPFSPAVRPLPDLRRALLQLQFECQWAVGDNMGGVDWMDLSKERDTRTSWSSGSYEGKAREQDEERGAAADSLEVACDKLDALSFADAYVRRRTDVAIEALEADFFPPGPTSLAGPTILPPAPHNRLRLPLSGREPEIASAIASLAGWREDGEESERVAMEQARLECVQTASNLTYPHLVDLPAPVLPHPATFVEYLPFIRLITAADGVHSAVPLALGEQAARARRSTRSSANVYQPCLSWSASEAKLVRESGFDE